jgi:hypothetical protein
VKLTAIFQKVPKGCIGFVEELPGANFQAPTLDEDRESVSEAVELDGTYTLRAPGIPYAHGFKGKNGLLRPDNPPPWNENAAATGA